jgi:flagellar hook protein FlgE
VTGGTAGTPSSLATGNLTFDSSGNLTSPAAPATVPVAIPGLSDGAAALNLTWNLDNTSGNPAITQYSQVSASSGTTVDGTAAAQLTQVGIANGGTIVAQFSNGTQQVVGQIAVAGIENPDSLVSTGQNEFSLSASSATPSIGAAGTGGRGQIEAGSLETSNVDIGTEFTRLMTYQNSYQADSKAITTIDQMQQALMQMKQ